MNNVLTRKHILISLGIHFGVFLVMAYVIHSNRINKTFLVFGAHSKKPTQAIMKFGHRPYVPFLGGKRVGKKGERGGKDKTALALRNQKELSKKLLIKNKKWLEKTSKPTVTKKEKSVLEKQTQLVAGAPGVSVHKKLLIKKVQAAKLKKLKELEEKRAEMERHEEQERRELKLLLARRVENLRRKEFQLEKALKKQDEEKKVLLAKKEEEAAQEELEADDHDDHLQDVGSDGAPERSEKIFAGNNQDIMEFNLLAESDQELRVYQRSIQQEVSRLWHPPVGVTKGTTCRVLFAVSRDGYIEQFEFVTRSKMLIYDLSILRIAKQFKFDNCLCGKRFTMDFCQ